MEVPFSRYSTIGAYPSESRVPIGKGDIYITPPRSVSPAPQGNTTELRRNTVLVSPEGVPGTKVGATRARSLSDSVLSPKDDSKESSSKEKRPSSIKGPSDSGSESDGEHSWTPICQEEVPALVPMIWNVLQGEQEYDAPDILPWHPQGFTVALMIERDSIDKFTRSQWILPGKQLLRTPVLKFHQIQPGSYRTSTYDISLASIFFKTTILSCTDTSVTFMNETTTHNVPFASFYHFYTRVTLRQTSHNTTKITVSMRLNFSDSTPWVLKTSIEQATRLKVRDHYSALALALQRLFSRGGLSGFLDNKFGTLALDRSNSTFTDPHSISSSSLGSVPSPKLLTQRSSSQGHHSTSSVLEKIEESSLLGALIWVLVIYGIISTIQMKFQLDMLLHQVETSTGV
jgi:hypothetical protein